MTMVFNPIDRTIRVHTSDGKEFACKPELLFSLDSDLADAARAAMASPALSIAVITHQQRSSIVAFRAR